MQGIFVHILCLGGVWWIFGGRYFLVSFLGDISSGFVHEFVSATGKGNPILLHWNRDVEFDCVLAVKDKSFAFVVINPHQM